MRSKRTAIGTLAEVQSDVDFESCQPAIIGQQPAYATRRHPPTGETCTYSFLAAGTLAFTAFTPNHTHLTCASLLISIGAARAIGFILKIISWNIAHRSYIWGDVCALDADIALLQEACEPPPESAAHLDVDCEPWRTAGIGIRHWRTAIVGLRRDWRIDRVTPRCLADARPGELAVSRLGTLSAAHVEHPAMSEVFSLLSMYSPWESPHSSTPSGWI
jgi:hypothetical protein